MTKDGAKRIKELEKEKKLLEQRNSQFEKVKYLENEAEFRLVHFFF